MDRERRGAGRYATPRSACRGSIPTRAGSREPCGSEASEGVYPVAGAPRIAVGAGAVWAANPDGSVSRIDPESGRLVATIEARFRAWTIAAGGEGVWFLARGSARR